MEFFSPPSKFDDCQALQENGVETIDLDVDGNKPENEVRSIHLDVHGDEQENEVRTVQFDAYGNLQENIVKTVQFANYRELRKNVLQSDSDDDTSSSGSDFSFGDVYRHAIPEIIPVKTKGELDIDDLPPVGELAISVNEQDLVIIGKIHATVTKQVVIKALKELAPLDTDSVLFLSHDKPLGRIFDVFGPVKEPFYVVLFDSSEAIKEKNIHVGDDVYFAPEKEDITTYVFLNVLTQEKGSDASWTDNNEPPEDRLDYSDDEKEKEARQNRKKEAATKLEEKGFVSNDVIYIPPPKPPQKTYDGTRWCTSARKSTDLVGQPRFYARGNINDCKPAAPLSRAHGLLLNPFQPFVPSYVSKGITTGPNQIPQNPNNRNFNPLVVINPVMRRPFSVLSPPSSSFVANQVPQLQNNQTPSNLVVTSSNPVNMNPPTQVLRTPLLTQPSFVNQMPQQRDNRNLNALVRPSSNPVRMNPPTTQVSRTPLFTPPPFVSNEMPQGQTFHPLPPVSSPNPVIMSRPPLLLSPPPTFGGQYQPRQSPYHGGNILFLNNPQQQPVPPISPFIVNSVPVHAVGINTLPVFGTQPQNNLAPNCFNGMQNNGSVYVPPVSNYNVNSNAFQTPIYGPGIGMVHPPPRSMVYTSNAMHTQAPNNGYLQRN